MFKKKSSQQEAREKTLEKWQSRWESSSKGRWTYNLIPNLKNWLERKHGDVDYYLTQFLSGHGGFKQYLHRFGLDDRPFCPFCTDDSIQDSRHVFFVCPRFDIERGLLNTQLSDRISVERITQIMVGSQAHWDSIAKYVKLILLELRRNFLE